MKFIILSILLTVATPYMKSMMLYTMVLWDLNSMKASKKYKDSIQCDTMGFSIWCITQRYAQWNTRWNTTMICDIVRRRANIIKCSMKCRILYIMIHLRVYDIVQNDTSENLDEMYDIIIHSEMYHRGWNVWYYTKWYISECMILYKMIHLILVYHFV